MYGLLWTTMNLNKNELKTFNSCIRKLEILSQKSRSNQKEQNVFICDFVINLKYDVKYYFFLFNCCLEICPSQKNSGAFLIKKISHFTQKFSHFVKNFPILLENLRILTQKVVFFAQKSMKILKFH